ncbi:hypothetical protein AK812_SmicGene33089 [Symbiodinium microadriaticum]|uniref:Uncharacterized protein n=2 Tax=Symbiodinium TaxID=2949 RepID=A0A1Q9CSJ0_SYMMI|nr:hypothetical protein AK812_SmicGene33089 [Symbiodinium microadriaticum]
MCRGGVRTLPRAVAGLWTELGAEVKLSSFAPGALASPGGFTWPALQECDSQRALQFQEVHEGESSAKDARPNGLGFGNVPESTLHMKRLSTQMLRCALAIRVQSREYFTERQIGRQAESQRATGNKRHFRSGFLADVFDLPPWWREDLVSPGNLDMQMARALTVPSCGKYASRFRCRSQAILAQSLCSISDPRRGQQTTCLSTTLETELLASHPSRMWLAKQTTRTIEASYVIVLLCFVLFMPFCFKVMPNEEIGAGAALPNACLEPGNNLLASSQIHEDGEAAQREPSLHIEQACIGRTDSVVSPLSMLIALIGGGVFSLEAFEAFPV